MSFTIQFICACPNVCVSKARNQNRVRDGRSTHANTTNGGRTCLLHPHANIRFTQLFDQRNHLEVIGLSMSKQPQMNRRERERTGEVKRREKKIQSNDLCDVFIRHYLQKERVSAFSVNKWEPQRNLSICVHSLKLLLPLSCSTLLSISH